VARKQNVNPLRFWVLVECVNGKHVNGKTHLNGAKNGNSIPAYVPLNGTHHASGEALA